MGLLSNFIPRRVARFSSPYNKQIEIVSWRGTTMLYVNAIQQSGNYTAKLWKNATSELIRRKSRARNILMFGVGGATAVPLLQQAYPGATITGVDIDAEIIGIAKRYFGAADSQNVTLEASDAKDWVARGRKAKKRFDIILIDLYIGNDVPAFASEAAFLTGVRRLLASGGIVVMNYFSYNDHKKRSGALLDTLSNIYQSVIRKDIFYNTFFYCS